MAVEPQIYHLSVYGRTSDALDQAKLTLSRVSGLCPYLAPCIVAPDQKHIIEHIDVDSGTFSNGEGH